MNGKKAKKLRKLAVSISSSLSDVSKKHILETNPLKIYAELKKIEKESKTGK